MNLLIKWPFQSLHDFSFFLSFKFHIDQCHDLFLLHFDDVIHLILWNLDLLDDAADFLELLQLFDLFKLFARIHSILMYHLVYHLMIC